VSKTMLLGESSQMRAIARIIEEVADTDATVLIRGECGVGKDHVARTIHAVSSRRDRPFVKVNCAAIPLGLLESELFGHERGAFTGAVRARPGRFELAKEGTIFLDEIGDMPLSMQAKILRVLQEREFERVGGTRTIAADVRVIAATHRDLEAAVAQGTFRQDLFYRLQGVGMRLPALRERLDDLPLLATHLLERAAKLLGVSERSLWYRIKKLGIQVRTPEDGPPAG
jgi:transcriptional regulator with GAF, ATPase, and Fis domain